MGFDVIKILNLVTFNCCRPPSLQRRKCRRLTTESVASLLCELARGFFTWTQFAELEPGAEAAHPAGTVCPSVACCHGISTKMLFLQHNTASSHINLWISRLFLCYAFCSGVYVKRVVGWLGNRLGHWEEGFRGWNVYLWSWKDHLVTVHKGKWMKEQNVITAGHCWEQCDCLKGPVSFLKTLDCEPLSLWSRLEKWISAIQHRQNHVDATLFYSSHLKTPKKYNLNNPMVTLCKNVWNLFWSFTI